MEKRRGTAFAGSPFFRENARTCVTPELYSIMDAGSDVNQVRGREGIYDA